jgi:LAO/AO transport system kinase
MSSPDPERLAGEVLTGSRTALSRAITLVESTRADHRAAARVLLSALSGHAGGANRLGISGVPGVGKSTFVESLGTHLTAAGHRVGVLAVDPSSVRTGGSVLGDKTRMPTLAADPKAYIRPSPSAGTLGGVARATAQTITVLEGGGYDVVLVETVGVGQSETTVAGMVDSFLLLGLARSGDQLQGIKKGVLEIADVVAINKADGDRVTEAKAAARDLAGALRLVRGHDSWVPPVLTCSGLTGDGVSEVWQAAIRHRQSLGEKGLADKRSAQRWELTWALVRDELDQRLRRSPAVIAAAEQLRSDVLADAIPAPSAADAILRAFDQM